MSVSGQVAAPNGGNVPLAPARGGGGRRFRRGVGAGVFAVALALGVVACGGDSGSGNTIADQAKSGDDLGYVAGDGGVEQLAPEQRKNPITLQGTTLDGQEWSVAEQQGSVVVLNVWGSWCQPCQAEAPFLEEAHESFAAADDVQFMGINVGESPETGKAAGQAWGMTYPSLTDPDRVLASSLDGLANATPTTLVLDAQGRVAARVSGAVTSASLLEGLIDDARAG